MYPCYTPVVLCAWMCAGEVSLWLYTPPSKSIGSTRVADTQTCMLKCSSLTLLNECGWGLVLAMRWLRLVGSLKTQVSFAKEPYNRDYILQKRPVFSRSLLIIATPCRLPFKGHIFRNNRSNSNAVVLCYWMCAGGVSFRPYTPLHLQKAYVTHEPLTPRHVCWNPLAVSSFLVSIPSRLPGLPIRDCAGSSNSLAQMRPKLSTTNVTAEVIFERLYLVPGLGPFGPRVNGPYVSTTPTVHPTTISRLPCNFFPRMDPHFAGQHDSPSNPAESRYPHPVAVSYSRATAMHFIPSSYLLLTRDVSKV